MTYSEKLKDVRWQQKRLEIFEKADWKCEFCGNQFAQTVDGKNLPFQLHIHHNFYTYNRDPWDYPNESLHCLCEICHSEITESTKDIKAWLGFASPIEIYELAQEILPDFNLVRSLYYAYQRNEFEHSNIKQR